MKCLRCGKEYEDNTIEVCKECGYDFKEGERVNKILNTKEDPYVPENKQTDLFDYPILSFVFSILGLIVPVMVLSVIAIILSKKPAKANLIPVANVGFVFGILGVAISSLFFIILILYFI